jgi:hypothetical protein
MGLRPYVPPLPLPRVEFNPLIFESSSPSSHAEDLLVAIYTALNAPIHPLDPPATAYPPSIRGAETDTDTDTDATHHTRLGTLKKAHYTWTGLRRDRAELVDGPAVRGLPDGQVDGGTWWLVLRKP